MNVVLKVKPPPDAASIAHSVMAYDRRTEELASEQPIPLFLDSLALKIAEVPEEDVYGAASYPLTPKAVDTFHFLLGLDADLQRRDYFIEASPGSTPAFSPAKKEAVSILSEVSRRPNRRRTERISESELVVPTLRILEANNRPWTTTTELIARLTELFSPSGTDAKILQARSDTYFSQKVRNMISHRNQPMSFINRGLAEYSAAKHSLRISDFGRSTIGALRS
jgi:hypothetical protein